MSLKITEHQLLAEAIQAFQEETGLQLQVTKEHIHINDCTVDAFLQFPGLKEELAVEVKKWAQQSNIGALVDQIRRLPQKGLLVADYVNPKMGEKLRAEGVEYFDAAGNAYINRPPVYIHITGNKYKETTSTTPKATNRAFDTTGLKVVFGFLCDPSLVKATYRQIAEHTGVALGTVTWVLNGLKDAGFITERGRGKGRANTKQRQLANKRKLLDRWVEAYPEKLKPKLLVGDFSAEDPYWWESIDIGEYGAWWGGELAAAKYTTYLKPQNITVYLPEQSGNKLLARARLKKANPAEHRNLVHVLRPFWPAALNRQNNERPGLVHPILAYADLIATGDSRNREAAIEIYKQYIAPGIEEYV
ncbi:type IV toxin-antitoxin system AbiEi family antitoxin [Agaribacterium haliotis]|uniref:type IV toxin-antitoxin system AbiEi family antitoxin n=1 Tax=Agaribacterium haliotis TaxID=2013869 RepID=UPI000BB59375|nr:type IV toxin-antitoxin system AbiEi family antitoxin [Agaribacterium haliotis]